MQAKIKTSFLLLVNMWQKKSWNLEQSLTWHDDDIKLFFINEEAPHRYLFRCTIGQTSKGQWNMFLKVMVCNQFVIIIFNHTCQISIYIEIPNHHLWASYNNYYLHTLEFFFLLQKLLNNYRINLRKHNHHNGYWIPQGWKWPTNTLGFTSSN